MKYVQMAAFLILTLCALGLSAQAQDSFLYKAESGVQGDNLEAITIIITQVKTNYAVTGEYVKYNTPCKLKGSYFPAGKRLRATCTYYDDSGMPSKEVDVTGHILTGKDAFAITVGDKIIGGEMVAYRDGKKPKGETASKSGECTLAGTWKTGTDWIYKISQNGKDFTWFMDKFQENGKGKLDGTSISASWEGSNGSGATKGTVTVDANGLATQITWDNGIVFKRQ